MINVWKQLFTLVPIIAIVFMFTFYSVPHTELTYDQLYLAYQNMEPYITPQSYAVREYSAGLFGTNFSRFTLEDCRFLYSEISSFNRTCCTTVPEITLYYKGGNPAGLTYLAYSILLSRGFTDSFLLVSEMEKDGHFIEGFSILTFFGDSGYVVLMDFSADFCRVSRVDEVINIEEVSYFKAKSAFS